MTDIEKMISGLIYDPADKELAEMRQAAHILSKKYNDLYENDDDRIKIRITVIFKDQSSLTMDVLPK